MAQTARGQGPRRGRHTLGRVRAGRESRSFHRGRGTGAYLQIGKRAALPRARGRHPARNACRRARAAGLRHALGREHVQSQDGRLPPLHTHRTIQRQGTASRAACGHEAGNPPGQPDLRERRARGTAARQHPRRKTVDFISQPARQQPLSRLRRLRRGADLSPMQRAPDLSLRQQPSHVSLLRLFRAGCDALPQVRRTDEAGRLRDAENPGGAGRPVSRHAGPAHGCRHGCSLRRTRGDPE